MKLSRRQFLRGLALALPAVTLSSLAHAQEPGGRTFPLPLIGGGKMAEAFPCTPVLDNANRPDEGPPMTGWTDILNGIIILSNQFQTNVFPGENVSYFNSVTTGVNGEVFVTISDIGDDSSSVSVYLISVTGRGYLWSWTRDDARGDTLTLFRSDGWGPDFNLGHVDRDVVNGDKLGLRQCGNTLYCYLYTGGTWTLLMTVVDVTYSGPYKLALSADGEDVCMDDFGGGNASDVCCGIPATEVPVVTTKCSEDPILALVCANGDRLDLISWQSGFELDDPGWRPQVAQFKGGGSYADSMIAEGSTLVAGEYANVVETIPLVARDVDETTCIRTYRYLQQFIKRASDYWKEPSEYDDVWLEVKPAGLNCRIGYARVVKAACADFANPFGQPFASQEPYSVADGLSLVVEREPLWRAVPPGEIIGPLYNLLKNPDFEDWNSGVADSQPDCWSDLEVVGITGTNGRDTAGPKWGKAAVVVDVTNSTGAGQAKGVTQVAEGTEDGQTYTVVVWVRNSGVTNGVGRLLVTSLLGQYEVYRSATQHGWTLYTETFTAGVGDIIGVNCEILSTAAGTDGTVYFDSLMLLKGDWEQEAIDGMLPYMTSSHIVNHWDTGAGDLNYVDTWEVPGDVDALVRLEVVNDTTPADYTAVVEKFGHVYVGQRRTGDVQNFQNYHDPAGIGGPGVVWSSGWSNRDAINFSLASSDWIDVTTHSVLGESDVADNVGRFRVLTRIYDDKASGDPTLEVRLAYWLGQTGAGAKFLTGVKIPYRALWSMVNITPNAAQIADAKFRPNMPGALSYTVQFRRSSGTGDVYLDYVLQLPTDGGFLEAEVTPGMEKGVALVADNTASSAVSATGIRMGYSYKVALSTYIVRGFASFLGNLYAGSSASGLPPLNGGIWQRKSGNWQKVYNTGGSIMALEVFNEKLYALHDPTAGNAQILSSSNGTSFGLEALTAVISGWSLKAFAGKLWIGLSGAQGYIYSWDGTALTLEFTYAGSALTYALEEYNGKLYLGIGDGTIYVYDPASGWSLSYNTGEASVYSLKTFQGKLYAGTGDNGRVFVYNGSAWALAYNPGLGFATQIRGMAVKDNMLLIGRSASVVTNAVLIQTSDGITWSTMYDPGIVDSIWAVAAHEGDVFMSVLPTALTNADIYTMVTDKPYEYSVANYQLGGGQNGGFTAPSRRLPDDPRRHRWVVSYDRSDGSNAIADKALVGIGYVSRYLALLGEG